MADGEYCPGCHHPTNQPHWDGCSLLCLWCKEVKGDNHKCEAVAMMLDIQNSQKDGKAKNHGSS